MRTENQNLKAFTLIELVVVLAIISAMVAVVLPLCKRSNDALEIRQHSSSVAQVLRYAIGLAEKKNKAVKFILDEKYRSYCLEIEDDENSFVELEDFTGVEKFYNENIDLFDIEGFEQTGSRYILVFDPQKAWPNALISFSNNDLTVIIRIKSRYVEVEEESV